MQNAMCHGMLWGLFIGMFAGGASLEARAESGTVGSQTGVAVRGVLKVPHNSPDGRPTKDLHFYV